MVCVIELFFLEIRFSSTKNSIFSDFEIDQWSHDHFTNFNWTVAAYSTAHLKARRRKYRRRRKKIKLRRRRRRRHCLQHNRFTAWQSAKGLIFIPFPFKPLCIWIILYLSLFFNKVFCLVLALVIVGRVFNWSLLSCFYNNTSRCSLGVFIAELICMQLWVCELA